MKDSAKNKKGAGPNAQCIDRPKASHDQFKISKPIIHIVNLLTKKIHCFSVSLFCKKYVYFKPEFALPALGTGG